MQRVINSTHIFILGVGIDMEPFIDRIINKISTKDRIIIGWTFIQAAARIVKRAEDAAPWQKDFYNGIETYDSRIVCFLFICSVLSSLLKNKVFIFS